MNRSGIVMVLIGVVLLVMMLPTLISGTQAAQVTSRTDVLASTTGVGETTDDVTIVGNLWQGALTSVTLIQSDNGSDVPTPTTYNTGTRVLTVGGLNANDTRTLSVTYNMAALTGSAEPAGTFLDFTPMLLVIAIVLLVVGGIVAFLR